MRRIPFQPSARLARLALFVLAISALGSPACSSRGPRGEAGDAAGDFPDVCEQYLATYGACMHRLLPQSAQTADDRLANARASLERVGDHEQLAQTCVNGTAQLRASCP